MNSKQLNYLLGAILVIALAVVVYMSLGSKTRNQTQNDQTATINTNTNKRLTNTDTSKPVATNQSQIVIDETANWKIYTSKNYSYTFKYPSNWSLAESSGYPYGVMILPAKDQNGNRNDALDIEPVNVGRESVFDFGANPGCKTVVINFGGRAAKECRENGQLGANYRAIQVTDLKGVNWENSNEVGYSLSDTNASTKIYDQILSTFKFTK